MENCDLLAVGNVGKNIFVRFQLNFIRVYVTTQCSFFLNPNEFWSLHIHRGKIRDGKLGENFRFVKCIAGPSQGLKSRGACSMYWVGRMCPPC